MCCVQVARGALTWHLLATYFNLPSHHIPSQSHLTALNELAEGPSSQN